MSQHPVCHESAENAPKRCGKPRKQPIMESMGTKRLPVTLNSADIIELTTFADPETPEGAALHEWALAHRTPLRLESETAVLRALAQVGAETLRNQALDAGYVKLALELSADLRGQKPSADKVDHTYSE